MCLAGNVRKGMTGFWLFFFKKEHSFCKGKHRSRPLAQQGGSS
jgi:hypothetical protein